MTIFPSVFVFFCLNDLYIIMTMSHHNFAEQQNTFFFSAVQKVDIFCSEGHIRNVTSVLYKPGDSDFYWVSPTTSELLQSYMP